jgi:hypothetical protein
VGQDVGLQEILGDLSGSRVANLVVRQVKLGDRFVQHKALEKDRDQVIIDEVAREAEADQVVCLFQAVLEELGIRHLHAEVRTLVLCSHVLCTVGQLKTHQVLEVVEN